MTIQPTTNYQLVYLHYERIHRTHPHWPLSDLTGMTPRQRKYWIAMGTLRAKQRAAEIRKTVERGEIPIG